MGDYLLYTPGHGSPMDDLMANGLVNLILRADPDASLSVSREGERYLIKARTSADDGRLCGILKEELELELRAYEVGDPRCKMRMCDTSGGQGVGFRIGDLDTAFKKLGGPLGVYGDPDHLLRLGEGRGVSKSALLKRVQMFVAPVMGSDAMASYRTYSASGSIRREGGHHTQKAGYHACTLCYALAWYGLVTSASVVRLGAHMFVASAAPLLAEGTEVALLSLVFGEKVLALNVEAPLSAVPLIVLSRGETILPLRGSFEVTVWDVVRGGATTTRGMATYPLNPLLRFVALAKGRSKVLVRLVDVLLRNDCGDLVAGLAETVVYGKDPYPVVRSIYAALEGMEPGDGRRGRYLRLLDRGVVEALLEVVGCT